MLEIDKTIPEIGRSIRKLDGCFIGACTTAEEEMILAALVLEVRLCMVLCVASAKRHEFRIVRLRHT